MHCHVRDMVVMVEEGNRPHPRCPFCYVLVPWEAINSFYINIYLCSKGAESECLNLDA